ncbi:hypothetical protein FHU10_1252 [Serratia fonticola]|uniref:Uncharacterized protein n=1 Tax=Serratia fonticola TaxID=47917 RepID=A0A559T2G7_SERFO|nr:hypothetical protein FHU09_1199 [Serratia fonticola]TQI99271.1 hypothetical protein FHU11_4853 [Serratia fonticola]TVZ68796.1 hypothetical protein FHU10_1252 [Serratia fonticola]
MRRVQTVIYPRIKLSFREGKQSENGHTAGTSPVAVLERIIIRVNVQTGDIMPLSASNATDCRIVRSGIYCA